MSEQGFRPEDAATAEPTQPADKPETTAVPSTSTATDVTQHPRHHWTNHRYKLTDFGGHETSYHALVALDKRHPGLDYRVTQGADNHYILTPCNQNTDVKLAGHITPQANLPTFSQIPIGRKETMGLIHRYPSSFPLEVFTDHPQIVRASWVGKNTNAPRRQVRIACTGSLPEVVDLGKFGRYRPKEPEREPTRCYKCQRYGHARWGCKEEEKCGICSGRHLTDICINKFHETGVKSQAKCPNCSRRHHAWSMDCPERPNTGRRRSRSRSPNRHTSTRRYEDAPPPRRPAWEQRTSHREVDNSGVPEPRTPAGERTPAEGNGSGPRRREESRDRSGAARDNQGMDDQLGGATIDQFYPRLQQPRGARGRRQPGERGNYHSRDRDDDPTTGETGGDRSTRPTSSSRPDALAREEMASRSDAHQRKRSDRGEDPQSSPFAQPLSGEEEEFMERLLQLLGYLGVPETGRAVLGALISPLVNGFRRYIRRVVERTLGALNSYDSAPTHIPLATGSSRDEEEAD